MDFRAFLDLIRRQRITMIIIVVATVLASSTIYFLQPSEKKLTLLFSTGISKESSSEKSLEAIGSADDFAKTIAGWMRAPTLAELVSEDAGTLVSLSATPQAKQNFLVEVRFDEDNDADNISQTTEQILNTEIEKYNASSKLKFFITLHGKSVANSRENPVKIITVALASGIFLAMMWIILGSCLGRSVSSIAEAEEILKTKAIVVFRNPKNEELNFLKKLVKSVQLPILLGVNVKAEKLRDKLNLGIKILEIPKDVEKINESEMKIIIVKLGKSKSNTLRMLKDVCEDKNVKLIVWN